MKIQKNDNSRILVRSSACNFVTSEKCFAHIKHLINLSEDYFVINLRIGKCTKVSGF